MDTQVLIVGAGPVGLTLAIDLGKRGIRCTLIEKNDAPLGYPKMERCNPRTMEIFRRLGIAETVRAAGYPPDWPMDTYLLFDLMRPPLFKMAHPTVAEAKARRDATTDGSLPLEPYQIISQYTLEPLLKSVAEKIPNIAVKFGHEFVSFTEQPDGVTAQVRKTNGEHDFDPRGIHGRLRWRLERGPQAARLQDGGRAEHPGDAPGAVPLPGALRQGARAARPPLPSHRRPLDADDRPGLAQALHDPCRRREGRGHEGAVRADRRHAGEIRDGALRQVDAAAAARRALPARPRLHRWRCRPPGDPDRRPRHEHRRRRCDRRVLEACRDAAGLGRAEALAILRGGAASDRRDQRQGIRAAAPPAA